MLSSYNAEMNSVISTFKDWKTNPDPDAYYLFVVSNFSQTDVEGYMPRNRRFGFVTKDQLDGRTIAHELGHGAFNLYHTFSTNGWGIAEKSTNNLMDYNNGNKLWKPQWDLIHNPEVTTGLFDGMDEGAAILEPNMPADSIKNLINKIHKANIDKVDYLDITNFALSQGNVKDLAIEQVKFDYLAIQISGELKSKDVGNDKNSDAVEKLFISPSSLIVEKSATPKGMDIDGYYTRYVFKQVVIENDKYVIKDNYSVIITTRGRYTQMLKGYLKGDPMPDIKFPCEECGRELFMTLDKLNRIFPGNKNLNQDYAIYLNDAFDKGGFSTCKRQAHFFSQVAIETQNFNKFKEDYDYCLSQIINKKEVGIYVTFGQQDNDSYLTLYKQDFWDKDEHNDYTGYSGCTHLYEKKDKPSDIKDKDKRYIGVGSITKTRKGLTITFPESFKKDTSGTYIKHTITDAEKCGENLFNLVYFNIPGLGNVNKGDGWKYRGRGAIHVTGRTNYRNASNKCNKTFSKNFDWETNPDDLRTNKEAIIYSAASWFLNNFNPIKDLDKKTTQEVTKTVNSARDQESERTEKFNKLINDINLFKCEIK